MKHRSSPITVDFAQLLQIEERIMKAQQARNTHIAYESGWKLFLEWCKAAHCDPLPADSKTVQNFVTWSIGEGYRLGTISLRLSAISYFHREAGFAKPFDGHKYIGCAKRDARERPGGKCALTYEMLVQIMRYFSNGCVGARNRAMVLLAFASGWRRSEITALEYRDVTFVPKGIEMLLNSSKTDQEAKGRLVGIEAGTRQETCPVQALQKWIAIRGTWPGPLFVRTCRGVGRDRELTKEGLEPRGEAMHTALKEALEKIGKDSKLFGAHSLRSGMITEAAKHGASASAIMQRTGHRSVETLQRYIRPATAFEFNPLRDVL